MVPGAVASPEWPDEVFLPNGDGTFRWVDRLTPIWVER
jgi:hypothetical protein